MSYILEALKRSQQERGETPGLALQVALAPSRPRREGAWSAAALLLALAAFALAAADRLAAPAVPPAEPAVAMPAAPSVPEAPAAAGSDGILAETAPEAAPAADGEDTGHGRLETDDHTRPAGPPRERELPPAVAKREGFPLPPVPARLTAPSPAAPPLETLPELAELPAELRARVGDLELNVHVHADQPEERFVFINHRLYGEGDAVAGGLRLERIVPKGAVLSLDGTRFRLTVGHL